MKKIYIERNIYTKRISPFIGKNLIKVLVGQRRVGKSYLLFQVMDKISRDNKNANIIYINKELQEFSNITNDSSLLEYIIAKSKKGKNNCIFIDEIQDIQSFEKALRHLVAKGDNDIYCTGSNSKLLSKEISTMLGGRYIEIPVYGLNYSEYLQFHNLSDSDESLFQYIKMGGLPYLKHLPIDTDIVYDYLRNVYNSIILKDVVERYQIRNVYFIERLVSYLSDTVGSLVSAKKISDFLKSQKTQITPNTVLNYLSFLTSTFFIYRVPRIDIKGKKVFEVNEKYYFEDIGMRNCIAGYRQADLGKIMENLVFNHLKINGYSVKVGQINSNEIDFVAEKDNNQVYIQVTYLLIDEKTKAREFGNLLKIDDNYEKIVVSLDPYAGGDFQGVKHIHLREFLSKWN